MSNTQTQIKGTVVLNSDTGANLTIGNATATNAITGTTNINTETPTDNLKTTTIGATFGAFNTNTALNGKTTINKPLIIGYVNPAKSITTANLSNIGGTAQIITALFTINNTLTAQSATVSQIPVNARYLFSIFLYIPPAGAIGEIRTQLVGSATTFNSGDISGWTGLGDGQIENYGYKPTNTLAFSIQCVNVIDVTFPFIFFGIGCLSANSIANCKLVFNIIRIG